MPPPPPPPPAPAAAAAGAADNDERRSIPSPSGADKDGYDRYYDDDYDYYEGGGREDEEVLRQLRRASSRLRDVQSELAVRIRQVKQLRIGEAVGKTEAA